MEKESAHVPIFPLRVRRATHRCRRGAPDNKTKRRYLPNLQYRRIWVESENRYVKMRLTTAGLRLLDKKGVDVVLAEMRERGEKV